MTTYRVWARPKPVTHQPRWCLQGGPVDGYSLQDAAAHATRWQELHPDHEVAVLPLTGSSPCTIA